MDIFEVIVKDHEKVKGILNQLESSAGHAKKSSEKLFDRLYKEIDVHATAEEHVFYPALQEFDEARDKVLESLEEHHVVRVLLGELKQLSASDEHWSAKLMVLKENLLHHMSEEEGTVFDLAQELLDDDEIDEITKDFVKDKKAVKANI